MKKGMKTGFTVIEVMLFLAVSALMFTGLAVNTSRNISSQRFSASVQDFSAFFRRIYNEVEDAQIANRTAITGTGREYCTIDSTRKITGATLPSSGRSECSVYGKLVTFGENGGKTIHVYDVIGDIVDQRHQIEANTEKEAYNAVKLGVLALDGTALTLSSYSYTLDWDAWVENINGDILSAAFLIVRSPLSGVIHTYYQTYSGSSAAKLNITSQYQAHSTAANLTVAKNNFASTGVAARISTQLSGYSTSTVNLCIDSDDRGNYRRSNFRIASDARNSSDIILVMQDGSDNQCVD